MFRHILHNLPSTNRTGVLIFYAVRAVSYFGTQYPALKIGGHEKVPFTECARTHTRGLKILCIKTELSLSRTL